MKNTGHPIHKELKVLRTVKSSQKMSEVVLRRETLPFIRDGIENKDKQQLQASCNINLLRIPNNNMVIWQPPACRVVFERLRGSAVGWMIFRI